MFTTWHSNIVNLEAFWVKSIALLGDTLSHIDGDLCKPGSRSGRRVQQTIAVGMPQGATLSLWINQQIKHKNLLKGMSIFPLAYSENKENLHRFNTWNGTFIPICLYDLILTKLLYSRWRR